MISTLKSLVSKLQISQHHVQTSGAEKKVINTTTITKDNIYEKIYSKRSSNGYTTFFQITAVFLGCCCWCFVPWCFLFCAYFADIQVAISESFIGIQYTSAHMHARLHYATF